MIFLDKGETVVLHWWESIAGNLVLTTRLKICPIALTKG